MKISIQDILIQEKLAALAHEAMEAADIIQKAYKNAFSLGETEITICNGYTEVAKISIDGTFKVNLGTINEVATKLTADSIFTCFVASYENQLTIENIGRFVLSGEKKDHDFGLTDEERNLCNITKTLREFIAQCKDKLQADSEATRCIK